MLPRTVESAFHRFQRHGDARALAIVFDRTAPELLSMARHLSRSEADAEDLVQATFLAAIEKAHQCERGRRVLPWLIGILANRARQARRRLRRDERPRPTARLDDVVDVHQQVVDNELRRELSRAIDGLPEQYRPVFRLFFEHGLEPQEIAVALERPAGTVRAQISRGLEVLRRVMPRGLASGAGGAATVGMAGRGLAAVRRVILDAPSVGSGAGAGLLSALGLGGLLLMHNKLLAGGAALVLGLLAYLAVAPELPLSGSTSGAAASTGVDVAGAMTDTQAAGRDSDERLVAEHDPVITPASPKLEPTPATTVVVVRVRDAGDGRALVGVGVALRELASMQGPGRGETFVRTDDAGEVRFGSPPLGRVLIDVDRSGAVASMIVRVGKVNEQVVELPAGVTVRGVVVDPGQRPVPGARVHLHGSRVGDAVVAIADAAGAFVVEHVTAGVTLQARAPGFAPSLAHAVVGGAGETAAMRLQIGAVGRRLDGVALGSDGAPMVGAVVALVPESGREVARLDRDAPRMQATWLRADERGRFTCDELAAETHAAFAVARGASREFAFAEVDATAQDAFVELRAEAPTVVGGVVSVRGEPQSGLQVLAWPERTEVRVGDLLNLVGMSTSVTDDEGRFAMRGVLPGHVVLRVMRHTALVAERRAELSAGQELSWDVDVAEVRDLRIAVDLTGVPAGFLGPTPLMVLIRRRDAGDGAAPGIVTLTRDGRGTYAGVRDGPVDVTVARIQGAASFVELLRLEGVPPDRGSVTAAIDAANLPARCLRGRAVDELGAPRPAQRIVAQRIDPAGLVVRVELLTDAAGRFDSGPLPPGRYHLVLGNRSLGTAHLLADRDEDLGDLKGED